MSQLSAVILQACKIAPQDCNLYVYDLRPYQKEAVEAICKEWSEGHQHTLLVLPTGTGKTVVFAKVVELKVGEGNSIWQLLHNQYRLLSNIYPDSYSDYSDELINVKLIKPFEDRVYGFFEDDNYAYMLTCSLNNDLLKQ